MIEDSIDTICYLVLTKPAKNPRPPLTGIPSV